MTALGWHWSINEEWAMRRADGHYLYRLGVWLHPLTEWTEAITVDAAFWTLLDAKTELAHLLKNSVYAIKTARASGLALLGAIEELEALTKDATPAP